MTKEEIFQEITGNPNIDDISIGDRMMPDEIRRAMDMWAESEVKKLSLKPPVMLSLPSVQELREASKNHPETFLSGALYVIDLIERKQGNGA